ncbi:MAG: diadenylate cyclase CdaA [Verrucomicrobiae bacterium]|nr:diadenylate cyclase CdaA [Verrucomicrobiae bacterium]
MVDFFLMRWRSGFEILLLSFVIYFILRYIRGTRGARVLLGLVLLLLFMAALSHVFDLKVIGWLLGHFLTFIVLALVVIFQPELRRALAELGGKPLFLFMSNEQVVVNALVRTAQSFSARKVGALIAVEREIDLRTLVEEGGALLDAQVSQELLDQLFFPNSPLHDGGVIIRNDRVVAAACIFPLTQRMDLAKSVGTRHRAALGLAEETDAVVLVVSEETGWISVACQKEFYQHLDAEKLQQLLKRLLLGSSDAGWGGGVKKTLRKAAGRLGFSHSTS